MHIRYICTATLTLALIVGAGRYEKYRLDAVSSASLGARKAGSGETVLEGIYLLGVAPSVPEREKLLADTFAALRGESVDFGKPRSLRLMYCDDEKALARYVASVVPRLEVSGLTLRTVALPPVKLRSKALVGEFDLFLTPRRVILNSDIPRLHAKSLDGRELESAL